MARKTHSLTVSDYRKKRRRNHRKIIKKIDRTKESGRHTPYNCYHISRGIRKDNPIVINDGAWCQACEDETNLLNEFYSQFRNTL